MRRESESKAEADEDDADVLHGVVGEQPLEVVLHQRAEHAEHAGDAGKADHQDAPPPRRRTQQVEDDGHEAVHGDLGHHAAHQGGDVAGGSRVGQRQPHVQRHQSGLGPGADQHEDQDDAGEGRRGGPDLGEGIAATTAGEQAEGQQQRERAEARHDDVDVTCAPVLGIGVVRHHQRPGRQRHELPGDEEGEGVVSQDDQVHAAEECRIERQHPAGRLLMLAIADGKQAGTGAAEVHHHQKERAERVHAVVRADPRQADGEPHRRRGKRPR